MSRQESIIALIKREFLDITHISLENESHNHHVLNGAETHFNLLLVATTFKNLSLVERHRMINNLLRGEFNTGLHALTLQLYTPEEWQKSKPRPSPKCKGGYGG